MNDSIPNRCFPKTCMLDDHNCSLKTKFDDVWLKTEDAASYLNISIGELRNKTSAGKIPFYKLGRSNRYLLSELRGLLFKNKRGVLYD